MKAHTILFVSYPLDIVECTCGATMKAAGALEWNEHRAEVGLTNKGHTSNRYGRWVREGDKWRLVKA